MGTLLRTVVIGMLLALALAACGEDAEDPAGETMDPADEAPADDVPADDDAPAAEDGDADVAVSSSSLGDILVDAQGMTLYVFEPDEQSSSTCYDDCAETWPALLADGDPQAGEGADTALIGTAERRDGGSQVTYNGWPLYYFSGDESPGDTNGQGIGDVWWVVGPDGEPVRDAG